MAGLAGPVYRQLAEWSLRQALPHCGTHPTLGVALPVSVLPNAELLAVDARHQTLAGPQATEYRGHKRPAEGGDRAFFYDGHCHSDRDWHSMALCRKTSASSLSTGT